ncbi:hypothetical protein V490_03716, partial [Pseudogymnoascus sp. VKM F-3557]
PHAAKKRRRAALLAEVAQLEADLSLAEAENARIRRHHEAGRRDVPAPKNGDAIFDLLVRAARPRAPLVEEKPRKKGLMMSVGGGGKGGGVAVVWRGGGGGSDGVSFCLLAAGVYVYDYDFGCCGRVGGGAAAA